MAATATATAPPAVGRRQQTEWTRQSMHQAIHEQHRALVIFQQDKVLDLTSFIARHPGGHRAIEQVVGTDATEAISVFHPPHVLTSRVPGFIVGRLVADSLEEKVAPLGQLSRSSAVCVEAKKAGVAMTPPDSPRSSSSTGSNDSDDITDDSAMMYADRSDSTGRMSAGRRRRLVDDYLALNVELRRLGFYEYDVWFYVRRVALFLVVWLAAVHTVWHHGDSLSHLTVAALMLAFVWHGLAFTVHDAGHHQVTGARRVDDVFATLTASVIGGLSVGWWRTNHNVHHIVTNDPEHDPDIQHLPFFAVSPRFFDNLYSTFHKRVMKFDLAAKVFVYFQSALYYFYLTFGRFNLHVLSWRHQLNMAETDGTEYRWMELACMSAFWAWYGYGLLYCCIQSWPLRLGFFWLSNAATVLLHVQITLSHFGMSTETVEGADELFVAKAVRTTMNVDCPAWLDWLHGGLNFQVEHHLFPRVPRQHFRAMSPLVQRFCARNNLHYHTYTFTRGNGIVLSALRDVANQIEFVVKVAVACGK